MDACVFGAKDTDAETTRLDALELSNAGCSGDLETLDPPCGDRYLPSVARGPGR